MADPPDAADLLKAIPRDKPLAIVLAGHNGSGKSTLWEQRFSDVLRIPLINADRLTLSILPSPLPLWAAELRDNDEQWQRIAQASVRSLVGEVIKQQASFAYETVFSHIRELLDGTMESKADLIRQFQETGYSVVLLFVGLTNSDISILRVETRRRKGGHAVPESKLRSRFPRTQRAVGLASNIADLTLMFDNSRNMKEAFTLVRAQSKAKMLYDCRFEVPGDEELLAVSSPWLNLVSPLASRTSI
jgi:predicted ABC-type ATPase